MSTKLRKAFMLVTAAAFALALGASGALAGHDDDERYDHHWRHSNKYKHKHGHSYGHHAHGYRPVPHHAVHHHGPARFAVPTVIRYASYDAYSPYYRGEIWYGPHRHAHTVYSFPVATQYGYVYEPHYYCHGSLVQHQVVYDGPRLSLRVGF